MNHTVERVAGVRDDDVETVEGLDRGVDEAVAEIGVGDVADAGDGIAAERLDRGYHLGRRLLVEIVYDDARAVARQLERERAPDAAPRSRNKGNLRSEEHTSELQSLMRISYAVFCLKKKKIHTL